MKKKLLTKIVALALSVLTIFSVTACGNRSGGIVNDPTTLNVKIHSAGYGITYIDAFKTGFEQTYKEENYKINIITPDPKMANERIFEEIFSDGGVDVYIGGVDAAESVDYNGIQCLMDITDIVKNKTPIGNNKVEGTNTILSFIQEDESNSYYFANGKYYGIPIAYSVGGLGVNTRVLKDEFGVTQLPRTTNELFAIVDTIMKKTAGEVESAGYLGVIHPFAYALTGNQYWAGLMSSWFLQYSGKEIAKQFYTFENADGTPMVTDCYTVFQDKGLYEAMNCVYQVYDRYVAVANVATDDFKKAQHHVMQGNAVFCPTGDWMYNEEKTLYDKYLNDVTFIKAPLISSLGTKVFGVAPYNFTADKCEELLIKIIDGADANLTVEQIKASLPTEFASVTNEDIALICERRGLYRDSQGESVYISNKSKKKDIAELFVRYLASEDGAKLFSKEANTTSPYMIGQLEESKGEWMKSVNKIFTNRYAQRMSTEIKGYREELGVVTMFYEHDSIATDIYNSKNSIFDYNTLRVKSGFSRASYKEWADALMDSIAARAKECVEKEIWN